MGIGIKRSETGGISNIAGSLIQQVGSLFSNFNKQKTDQDGKIGEGVISEQESELSLDLDDKEILALVKQWQEAFDLYYGNIKKRQDENEKYWFGKQYGWDRPDYTLVDNIIFESVETLLPLVSRQNPTPLVLADNSEMGIFVADNTAKMLEFISDEQSLKLKIKQMMRHWCLYLLGCTKIGWDYEQNEICLTVVRPQNIILDPSGTFDGGEFTGRYIGERKRDDAKTLIVRFPGKEEEITQMVGGKMGTELGYVEWWTDEYVCWVMGDMVLDKRKNPHWNYPQEQMMVDDFGNKTQQNITSANHFKAPKMPYSFAWVFNTGKGPFDETSLIEQSKSLQDVINKRARQIDRNADDTNNGWIFSNVFDMDDANRALSAMRKGGAIIAPTPSIAESVTRFPAPSLASYVLEDMYDKREQIRNIMGVRGSTAAGIMNEKTVRGKIEIKGQDVDRVSLIVEHLEQTVDYVFNYMVQMMYVYYDEPHTASLLGNEKAVEYVTIQKNDLNRQLVVSVKEGSMIPQDPLTRRNEAMDLFAAGAIDPATLFERLDFPNPKESADKLAIYKMGGMAPAGAGVPAETPMVAPDQSGMPMGQLPPLPPITK